MGLNQPKTPTLGTPCAFFLYLPPLETFLCCLNGRWWGFQALTNNCTMCNANNLNTINEMQYNSSGLIEKTALILQMKPNQRNAIKLQWTTFMYKG